mmetsp:Transcript_33561/g.6091  ORF Transcript_33561/g.6091 Transcript_33561/m.6091 type:complete len:114 (-) Transcript_33561:992-1333(-)
MSDKSLYCKILEISVVKVDSGIKSSPVLYKTHIDLRRSNLKRRAIDNNSCLILSSIYSLDKSAYKYSQKSFKASIEIYPRSIILIPFCISLYVNSNNLGHLAFTMTECTLKNP